MPIPSKRPGQSKKAFMSSCMSDKVMLKEYPDQAQRAAICYSRFGEKKAKADYVMTTASDETLYTKSTFLLPESLIAKVKTLPESQRGQHQVRVTLKDGSTRDGVVLAHQDFETYDDCEDVIADDIVDLALND